MAGRDIHFEARRQGAPRRDGRHYARSFTSAMGGFDELAPAYLPAPRPDCGDRRPRVVGRVEFDGIEGPRVVIEPFAGLGALGIKSSAPTPVEPSRTADVTRGSELRALLRRFGSLEDARTAHVRGAFDARLPLLFAARCAFRKPLLPTQRRSFWKCRPRRASTRHLDAMRLQNRLATGDGDGRA